MTAARLPTIRTMRSSDVPAVSALEEVLFPHDAWPTRFFYDELRQAQPDASGAPGTRRYWIAEDSASHEVVGYAGMMCVPPLADVQTLAVAPAAQDRGLGSRLLALIEEESVRRGAADLLLEVRADNPGAQRLYLRRGFTQIHQRRRYYPDGGDAIIMRKHLQPRPPSSAANLRSP